MIRYTSTISLPNLQLYFYREIAKEYLLVAGGRSPADTWLKMSAIGRTVFCIDRGADACYAAKIVPSLFIGDGDSANAKTLAWLHSLHIKTMLYPPEKDKTDTQLALDLFAGNKEDFVILTGGFGGRFDHLFSLLYAFAGSKVNGCIADEREFLVILRDNECIELELEAVPSSISLLPLSPECTGVNLSGVYWPLSGATLRQNNPYAISNRLATSEHRITVANGSGTLAFYLCWNESGS